MHSLIIGEIAAVTVGCAIDWSMERERTEHDFMRAAVLKSSSIRRKMITRMRMYSSSRAISFADLGTIISHHVSYVVRKSFCAYVGTVTTTVIRFSVSTTSSFGTIDDRSFTARDPPVLRLAAWYCCFKAE